MMIYGSNQTDKTINMVNNVTHFQLLGGLLLDCSFVIESSLNFKAH